MYFPHLVWMEKKFPNYADAAESKTFSTIPAYGRLSTEIQVAN